MMGSDQASLGMGVNFDDRIVNALFVPSLCAAVGDGADTRDDEIGALLRGLRDKV